jgi:hypothetical protein
MKPQNPSVAVNLQPKPRLSEKNARLAMQLWTRNHWDTRTIAVMLGRSEAAVYNSLAEMKGTVDRECVALPVD